MKDHRLKAFIFVAAALLSIPLGTGCKKKSGDNDGPPPAPSSLLAFVVQPSNANSGAVIAPPITVEIRNGSNVLIPTATNTVTLAIQFNAGGATLGGTLSRAAVGGTATFNDITVSAGGNGYTLRATAAGYTAAVSNAFNITGVVGPATQLVITTQPPGTVAPYEAFTVVVEARDGGGAVDTTYTGPVTIAFEATPAGDLLYHTSGFDPVVHELINAGTPAVLGTVTPTLDTLEVHSMVFDPTINLLRFANFSGEFWLVDPGTGDSAPYANTVTLTNTCKGLAFNGMGEIRALHAYDDQVSTIDLVTGEETDLGTTLTLSGFTVSGCTGLARHPTSGVFYAILKVTTNFPPDPRMLVTVNMGTGVCTLVGDTGDAVSSITFGPDGTLYATTGDGAVAPEELWTVDISDGSLTSLLALGNGEDGEVVAFFPRRLGGTLTVNAVSGVATFNGLSIDQLGSGYTLTVTSGVLTPDTSAPIDVTGAVSPSATIEFSSATSSVAENVGGGLATITLSLSVAEAHNMPVMIYIDPFAGTAIGIEDHNQPYAFQVTIP
ncbi:MAG TPA: hypothetical protein VK736_10730, partial [Candidatus Binatia bacterium]|nr:hypothetical protein [Candidatus Binatia bacterium]